MSKKNKSQHKGITVTKSAESKLNNLLAMPISDDELTQHTIGELTQSIIKMANEDIEMPDREKVFSHLVSKLLNEDKIWYVFNNVTEYPMSFVPVTMNKDGYSIRLGDMWIVTKEYREKVALEIASNPDYSLKSVSHDDIKDFFTTMFYTNGYGGIRCNYLQFSIARENIVDKPKPDVLSDAKDLIKNPIVVNRLISANQYIYTETSLNELEELTKKICIQAFVDECKNANFLLAVRPADDRIFKFNDGKPSNGKLLFETIKNPKTGREVVPFFTDWSKTEGIAHCEGTIPRMMKIKDVIDKFDVCINISENQAHSGIITKEMFSKKQK